MSPHVQSRLTVAVDPALAPYAPEVKYALRTLLSSAGYPCEFLWSTQVGPGDEIDVYYGNEDLGSQPSMYIRAFPQGFKRWSALEPERVIDQENLPFLCFDERFDPPVQRSGTCCEIHNDIVFGSFWLLVGAAEAKVRRDRWDNLHVEDAFIVKSGLVQRPAVSLYAAFLRQHFERQGRPALKPNWVAGDKRAAFSFTHDVDYPQMIRWIETLRLLRSRGTRALSSIAGIWRGTNHFWKFTDWVDFEKTVGARPAFYFMARQGSLLQYARGTPDAFYDVRSAEFQKLFPYLREHGCEIGLHASYHAHRSVAQLAHEKSLLEAAAGITVRGGRHHYWHLDPEDAHGTLLKHEQIGMQYDSSLGFEFFPGFRRGICHPFRVFHAGQRRELDVVQLPPTWMDDHFDRRRAVNHIEEPDRVALDLMNVARATGGVIIVDYHARGMNEDFYPRYGRWLREFAAHNFDGTLYHCTPAELTRAYQDLMSSLHAHSRDRTLDGPLAAVHSSADA